MMTMATLRVGHKVSMDLDAPQSAPSGCLRLLEVDRGGRVCRYDRMWQKPSTTKNQWLIFKISN